MPNIIKRMSRKTRKTRRRQRGGAGQKEHSLSQLWRYASDASSGKPFNSLQFGYNLGRLQEMVEPGVEGAQRRWWVPTEPLVNSSEWEELKNLIKGDLKHRSGVDFDKEFLESKGVSPP